MVLSVSKRVQFYEIRGENLERLKQLDYASEFFDVIDVLPTGAPDHWENERGVRARGRRYQPGDEAGTQQRERVPLLVIDRVHREPAFKYHQRGQYSDHRFVDEEQEFAEPKFLAFFERNVVATFQGGLRMPMVQACLNTWRAAQNRASIVFEPVIDFERLQRMQTVDSVARLRVAMPADMAAELYKQRQTPIARMLKTQANRQAIVSLNLEIDPADEEGMEEMREELAFLLEDDDTYATLSRSSDTAVEATYYEEDSGRARSHNFLGQVLGVSVRVDIPEPEKGPEAHHASEALAKAYARRQEVLASVVPPV